MLPDYPKTKSKLLKKIGEAIEQVHNFHMGIFTHVEASLMHEGSKDIIVRSDGTTQEMIPKHVHFSAVLKADRKRFEELNLQDFRTFILEIGEQFARDKLKVIYETLETEIKKAGNVVGPEKHGVDQVLEMFEKRQFDFDEYGHPVPGNFVLVNPIMHAHFIDMLHQIQSTPELRQRLEAIMASKWRDFLDREAARKLVD